MTHKARLLLTSTSWTINTRCSIVRDIAIDLAKALSARIAHELNTKKDTMPRNIRKDSTVTTDCIDSRANKDMLNDF
jgi:hypothetical protein